MTDLILDKDGNFTVQDSEFLSVFYGSVLLLLSLGIMASWDDKISLFIVIPLVPLIVAIGFFVKAKKKKVYIVINNDGIYYKSKLITNWENFLNAYIFLEPYKINQYSNGTYDKFRIDIIYKDSGNNLTYMYKIPMTSTLNKSEYDIISAITHFSGKQLSMEIFE